MEMLLKFLSRFSWLVGTFNEDSFISALAKHLPNTLYKLKKHLGLLNSDDFVKYVVCSMCKTLYDQANEKVIIFICQYTLNY